MNLLLITALAGRAQQVLLPYSGKPKNTDSLKNFPIRLLPEDYYSHNLSFFCKKELQIEKMTKIPFRIRLGSLDYVDALEGKGKRIKQQPKEIAKN